MYNSLNFYQQQRFFTPNYVDIDDLARVLADEHNFPYEGSADFLSDFAKNVWGQKETRFSFADNAAPTEAEVKEAERQKDEVKAKWTNPDGTPKKGYHCAPNGEPSRLTEDQWLWVRTPNFKRWFGDWETLAEAYPERKIFDIDEAYKFARGNLQGKEFTSKDGHAATLGRNGIDKMNSGLARGKTGNNRIHALALANVGKLFEKSELLESEPPRDGDSNIKQYLKFYAPLFMDGRFYVVKITARELHDGNKLYSLEGLDIIEESEYRGQPRGSKENSISADYSDSVKDFVKKIREVKGNVSRVVDENGEPMVVYHGTERGGFTVFDKDLIESEYGFFFNDRKAVADEYADTPDGYEPMGENKVYAVFLNIRNPYEKDFKGASYGDLWTEMDIVKEEGRDGFIGRNIVDNRYGDSENTIPSTDYVVLNSNQIKSATDNVGTFSENPDIRWSFEDGENVDRILSLTPERALELLNGSIAGFEKRYDEAREKWKASRKDGGWVYDDGVEGYVRRIEFENGTVEGFKVSEDADETYSAFVDDDYKEFPDEFDAADALWESYKRENEITETDDHITAFEAFCEMFRDLLGDEDGFFDEGYSNKSESRYVEFGGYDERGVKIRFSDHNLPPFYKQPDFNVWGVESLRKRLPEIIEAVKAGAEQSERDRLADEDADGELRWSFSPAEIKRELLSQKKIEIKSDKTTEKLLGEFSAQEKGWVGRVVKILSGILPKSVMSRIGEVSISNGSIKSALNHSRGKLKVQVLPQLEEILTDSIPITKEPIARSDGQLSYPMSRVIEWNGVPYVMTSVILEDKNGKRFYNHELTEIKRLDDAVHSGEDLYPRASEANKHRRALNEILYNDIWNVKKNADENKSKKIDFSFADNPIHQRKRALAVKLAKDMYGRLGKDFDASAPEARREVVPTEAERERILMDDLSFLDSDVEDVCNRATAILWKLIHGTPKKTLKSDFDRMAVEAEKSFEYSRIVEACVKDALNDFKKELDISEKMKAQERKDAQKEMDSVKGFTVDELALDGIDLFSAITEYSQAENGGFVFDADAINAHIDAIIERCRKWAEDEGVSYDLAFAKMRATLTEVFNDLTDRLVYGKHVKSACQAVLSIAEANAERQLSDRAKKIGAKFAK